MDITIGNAFSGAADYFGQREGYAQRTGSFGSQGADKSVADYGAEWADRAVRAGQPERITPRPENNNEDQNTNQQTQNEDTVELSPEARRTLEKLKATDTAVRAHEAAHLAAAAGIATGGAQFSTTRGPDGKMYATGGEVGIDASEVPNNPDATLAKARQVVAAALAPADPSPQDMAVAAQGRNMEAKASAEIAAQKVAERTEENQENQETNATNSNNTNNVETEIIGTATGTVDSAYNANSADVVGRPDSADRAGSADSVNIMGTATNANNSESARAVTSGTNEASGAANRAGREAAQATRTRQAMSTYNAYSAYSAAFNPIASAYQAVA